MKISVKEKSDKTLKYQEYIFRKLIENSPLEKGEVIEVRVDEKRTPFPQIKEIPVDDPHGRFIPKGSSMRHIKIGKKLIAVESYTEKLVAPFAKLIGIGVYDENDAVINFSFVIIDPEKIYKMATGSSGKIFLNKVGELWHEPKSDHCYPIKKGSRRHRIVDFLVENNGLQETPYIANKCGIKNTQTVRNTIGGINKTADRFLKLNGGKIINSKSGSGYEINPKHKIIVV